MRTENWSLRQYGCTCVLLLVLLGSMTSTEAQQSREHIDYWKKYGELTATEDPRAQQAQRIFQQLVQVAGKRPGKTPQLFITRSDPWNVALPIALGDGWIVLSKRTLEICYQDPHHGNDRLAFVLGHEIAHQLNDDLWHIRFFQALEASTAKNTAELEKLRPAVGTVEQVLDRELKADEYGMLYAAMAGFQTQAIVTGDRSVNFFADWIRALDPRRLDRVALDQLRPTPQERAEALRAHLQQKVNQVAMFQAGLWFYEAGNYQQAIRAFADFYGVFPSREVAHNLATSHHQLALQSYQAWKKDVPPVPFHLALAIDPLTRASRIYLEDPTRRGEAGATPVERFRQHINDAIALYREALTHEVGYIPAAINLGCALIVRGVQAGTSGLNADFTDAVTTLLRAWEYAQHTAYAPVLLNTLGVALFYNKQLEQAKEELERAKTLAPSSAAVLFNLGQIAHMEHRDADAQRYWSAYQHVRRNPSPTAAPNTPRPEQVMGVTIGRLEAQVPSAWGRAATSTFQMDKHTWTVASYPVGVMTLARNGEILMLLAQAGYRQASVTGIALDSAAGDVLAAYGPPSRRLATTQGETWSYDTHRIAFRLQQDKVVSWLVF